MPAQRLRHTTVVLAATTSLCLTFAAGAYIVNNTLTAAPPQEAIAAPDTTGQFPELHDTAGRAQPVGYSPDPYPVSTAAITTGTSDDAPTPRSDATEPETGLGGRVHLGTTYVGAALGSPEDDIVTVTVDTNVLSALTHSLPSEKLRSYLGRVEAEEHGVTAIRTEVDPQDGALTLVFTDPAIGERTVRLQTGSPGAADSGDTRPSVAAPSPQPTATPETTTDDPGDDTAAEAGTGRPKLIAR